MVIALVATLFSFVLFRTLPGDAVTNIAQSPRITPEVQEALRHNFGLDRPLWTQYVLYMRELVQGNLGVSFTDAQPVSGKIIQAAKNTIPMALLGTMMGMVVGTIIGVNAAYRQGSARDRVITGSAMILYSLPVQWIGLLMLVWFAGVLPTSGMSDPYLIDAGFWATAQDRLLHMLLPATCVALLLFGAFALVVRSSQLEALSDDHVLTARAKGYGNRRVVWREAFRSAMLPLVSLSTLTLGFLIGGGILVETVFGWPGVGRLTVQAVGARNFLGDVLHAVLDPRVAE